MNDDMHDETGGWAMSKDFEKGSTKCIMFTL